MFTHMSIYRREISKLKALQTPARISASMLVRPRACTDDLGIADVLSIARAWACRYSK